MQKDKPIKPAAVPRRKLSIREFFYHPEPAGICLTLVTCSPIQPQA